MIRHFLIWLPGLLITTTLCSQPVGMVSAAHPLATEAGFDILEQGGNAFDAAVAVAATLNVVEPMMSGMGGYGTILIYDAENKQVRFLDSSGKIPMKTNSDLMRPPTPDWEDNRYGPKSISTPGNVNAWDALSREYGTLDWDKLFKTAITLAEKGFPVSARTAGMIQRSWDQMPVHAQEFYGIDGAPLPEGQILIQSDLAQSFRILAKEGRKAFYEGQLATVITRAMRLNGSFLSAEDLANDEAEWWDPISIEYHGYEVFTASPPANSFPGLIRLGLMREMGNTDIEHNSEEYLHRYAEITKSAYWCRLRYAGDPEISPPPLERLLSQTYLQEVVAGIDDRAVPFTPPEYTSNTGQNTTHFVVADKWGNIVSATQTLGNLFGSKVMPEGTGIWMNNSLAYCTYEPKGNPMDAHPGQRKLSGDMPVIVFKDGRPVIAIGTPGGHTIPQTVPQMLMNMIDFGMSIEEAIAAPRISFIEPDKLAVERGISKKVFKGLQSRGHKLMKDVWGIGNAHGLEIEYSTDGKISAFRGAADPRGEGSAAIGSTRDR